MSGMWREKPQLWHFCTIWPLWKGFIGAFRSSRGLIFAGLSKLRAFGGDWRISLDKCPEIEVTYIGFDRVGGSFWPLRGEFKGNSGKKDKAVLSELREIGLCLLA